MARYSTLSYVACVMGATAALAPAASADPVADFYAGKTLTFIVAASPGGGYNLYSRVLMRHMPRHVPGKPSVVVQNMAGAGGIKAANYMFNVSPRDGSVAGMPISSIVLAESLRPKKVKFRAQQFGWVGTVTTMTDVLAVYADTGVKSIDDAKKKPVVIGATGKLGTLYLQVALVNQLLGTRFKIVEGYKSGAQTNLAMDRNEVSGRTNQWTSWKTQRPQWISGGKLSYLLQYGPKIPELGGVPRFRDLLKKGKDREMADLMELIQLVGRSAKTPPGVPATRVAALRRAFDATMKDAAFLAEMKEKNLIVNPRSGETLQADLNRVLPKAGAVSARIKQVLKLN